MKNITDRISSSKDDILEENLKYYLENTIVTKSAIESRLVHPITRLRYPTRLAYELLKKYSIDFFTSGSEPRFISLAGLRGVGKTTLLWQTANYIYQNHHKKELYFFNVNTLKNLGIPLHIALEEFQKQILKKRFHEISKPITILLDEVHDDENWSRTLKILYDEARYAFILCTGSSALLLNQTADLARRMRTEKIYPFKFIEFIASKTTLENGRKLYPVKDVSSDLKEAIFYSDSAQSVYDKMMLINDKVTKYLEDVAVCTKSRLNDLIEGYVSYQNIPSFLFYNNKYTINDSILELFKRVILEDIPKLRPTTTDFMNIERLVLRLAGSDEINPETLAGIIGVKKDEINELIDILAKAELLNVLRPYGGLDTKIFKNQKAFFMSPSLRRALLSTLYGQNIPNHFMSKSIEDIIVMYLKGILADVVISYSAGIHQSNPDFVIETRDRPVLLEIGTGKTSTRQIKKSNMKYRYGLLVSNGCSSPILKSDTILIPLNWFLLL